MGVLGRVLFVSHGGGAKKKWASLRNCRLTLLEPQSRFGDNWGQLTWNLSGLSPKRDWSSKRVKDTKRNTSVEELGNVLVRTCSLPRRATLCRGIDEQW